MFLAFVAVGLLAIVTALRGNQAQVAAQLEQDFTSKSAGPSFWTWIGALILLAIIGRVTGATNAVRLFIVLLIVVYIVANRGLLANFKSALNPAPPAPVSTSESGAAQDATATPGAAQSAIAGASGSNPLSSVTGALSGAAGAAKSISTAAGIFGGLLA